MESLKEVDWSKAPEGATHYNAECEYPWLKETPASYFKGDGWIEYSDLSNKYAMNHLRNAVKRHQGWGGVGLPPVGAVCEYYWSEGLAWRKCEIVAHYYGSVVAVDVLDITAARLPAGLFRPIKTPEQITAEERQHAIDEMMDFLGYYSTTRDAMGVLYDAGYRKTEVKK